MPFIKKINKSKTKNIKNKKKNLLYTEKYTPKPLMEAEYISKKLKQAVKKKSIQTVNNFTIVEQIQKLLKKIK